ncbi:unnamed protein product, partial [Chrysoparadoxa australica]
AKQVALKVAEKTTKLVERAKGDRPAPHKSEKWGLEGCLKRCNCEHGVPDNDALYIPCESHRTVTIKQGEHEVSIDVREGPPEDHKLLEEESRAWVAVMPPPPSALDKVLDYMDARTIATVARVDRTFYDEVMRFDDNGLPAHPNYMS